MCVTRHPGMRHACFLMMHLFTGAAAAILPACLLCMQEAMACCQPQYPLLRTFTVLSSDAVASILPSDEKDTERTVPVWAFSTVERPSLQHVADWVVMRQ